MRETVHTAEPGDIYVDEQGKLWRCIGLWREPTVQFQEVEPGHHQTYVDGSGVAKAPQTMRGGVSGLMWNGFTRIHRPKPTPGVPARYGDGA